MCVCVRVSFRRGKEREKKMNARLMMHIMMVVIVGIALRQALLLRKHYGDCGRLIERAERTAEQDACKNPLTRIDNEFIKCQSADTILADGQMLCAVNQLAASWDPQTLVTGFTEMSVTSLLVLLAITGYLLHLAANAYIEDRQNARQVAFMRDSFPMLVDRQQQWVQQPYQEPVYALGHQQYPWQQRAPRVIAYDD